VESDDWGMPVAARKRSAHFGAKMLTLVARYPDLSEKATKNVNASVEIEVRNLALLYYYDQFGRHASQA